MRHRVVVPFDGVAERAQGASRASRQGAIGIKIFAGIMLGLGFHLLNRLTGHSAGFFSVYTMPPNQAVSIESQRKINTRRRQSPPQPPKGAGFDFDRVGQFCDEIKGVAQVQAGNRAARALQLAVVDAEHHGTIDVLVAGRGDDHLLRARGEVRTACYLNGYPPGGRAIYFSRIAGQPPDYGDGTDYVDRMKLRFQFEAA